MKAEEALESAYKIIRDNQSDKHEDVDPPLINAIKEYARIQIEKDRENSKLLLKQHLQTHVAGYTPCCIEVFKNRPINLD